MAKKTRLDNTVIKRPPLYIKAELWDAFKALSQPVERRSANEILVFFIEDFVEKHKDKLAKKEA